MAAADVIRLDLAFILNIILLVTADKGGTGKSFVSRTIIDGLEAAGILYTLMECDLGVSDTARIYKSGTTYDIDRPEGWRALYEDLVKAPQDRPVIITMPGGFLQRVKTHLPAFLTIMGKLPEHLGRPIRAVWAADDKRDVIESLRSFRLATNGQMTIDLVKNEHFCPANQFRLFDLSEERRILERNGGQILRLPELAYRIAQPITNERLSRKRVLERLDLLDAAEYDMWWDETAAIFRSAGYFP